MSLDFPLDTFVCSSTLIAPDVVLFIAHVDTDSISFGPDGRCANGGLDKQTSRMERHDSEPELPADAIPAQSGSSMRVLTSTTGLGLVITAILLIVLVEPVLDIKPLTYRHLKKTA